MVPSRLCRPRRAEFPGRVRATGLLIAAGLGLLAGCHAKDAGSTAASAEERAAFAVRDQYTARDVVANAAWTWTSPAGPVFVMVDVESGVEGVAQATADLWMVADGKAQRVGRSELLPSVASMGVFVFEDLTGDGLPDVLGAVADSAQVEYPVFFPGARANLTEEIETAGTGYHFSTGEENTPTVLRGP
ncbi:MAG: hypothetical protein ABSB58_05380, partial [Gemmatimonadales bacterium]